MWREYENLWPFALLLIWHKVSDGEPAKTEAGGAI